LEFSDCSYKHLPFSKLFKTYVQDFQQLSEFYTTNPFDGQQIARRINEFSFAGDRQQTVEVLTALNNQFNVDSAALKNIKRLQDERSLVVVTGQQLGIYGGPLYTYLKTISTIHKAQQLERKHDRPVIPVFWLADEDHDYDEIRSITVLNDDQPEQVALPPQKDQHAAVADMKIPEHIEQLRNRLRNSMFDTDFSDELWELLNSSFRSGATFFEAFGHYISKLFSKHGLVLAGSNHPDVKKITGHFLKRSITDADQIRHALDSQTNELREEYHQQVTLYDSNLFYMDEETGRTKINRNSDRWHAGTTEEWQTEQLTAQIERHPELFSPNVFMRPILQDMLLPTIGYVAGPGETAYFGQMKGMYDCFDLEMPVIFPRLSATMVEPAINRILDQLPFEWHEYDNRIEDLESEYVDRTEQHDIEAIFSDWKEKVQQLSDPKASEIAEIDPTLEGAAEKATSTYFNELNKLKGKVYRAVKKQDEIQLNRIKRIQSNLFPNGSLQERIFAGIFFMNKYDVDIWDNILAALDEEEQFDHHKLIYL
jgi:bacillithiol biosynthesis cysteine-adding enzyme BshC